MYAKLKILVYNYLKLQLTNKICQVDLYAFYLHLLPTKQVTMSFCSSERL